MGIKNRLSPGALLPREKALKEGRASLTDSELIALLLDFGTEKEDVLSLSSRFLNDKGGLRGIFSSTYSDLLTFGVKKAKIFRFLAVSEISRRLMLNKDDLIRDSESAFLLTKPYFFGRKQERIRTIYLSKGKRVIKKDIFESEREERVYLPVSEITREAIRVDAFFVLVLHNHPSGRISPSPADLFSTLALYKSLANANRVLLDSLIVNGEEHLSFRKSGLGPFSDKERKG